MKNRLLLDALSMDSIDMAMVQSVTVYVPSGYKVAVVPDSASIPWVVSIVIMPQTIYAAPAPVPACRPYPYVRHLTSIGEGMVIEHRIDDHHHQFEDA